MSIAWKQFQFYHSVPIRDPLLGNDNPLYSDPNLTAITMTTDHDTYNTSLLIMATSQPTVSVQIIDLQNVSVLAKFNVLEHNHKDYIIAHLHIINNNQWLMIMLKSTIIPSQPMIIRFYQLNKLISYNNSITPPQFHSEVIISTQRDNTPLCSFDITPDLSLLALSYLNGDIIVVRGDIAHDKGSRQRKIYSGKDPILSIDLVPTVKDYIIIASTLTQILTFSTRGDNKGLPTSVLADNLSLQLGGIVWDPVQLKIWVLDTQERNLISFKLNNEREIIALPPFLQDQNETLISIKHLFLLDSTHLLFIVEEYPRQHSETYQMIHKFVILDTKNHIVAFNTLVQDPILEYLGQSDNKFSLLSTNGVLYQINKKSFDDVIDVILSKNDYPLAIEFVERTANNKDKLYQIHEKFATYLFNQGEFLDSVNQYVLCLPIIDVNEILTKFSSDSSASPHINDKETNHILSVFLWSLMENQLANSDHITLLLIILIKLNRIDDLNKFIQHFNRSGQYTKEILHNDISDEEFFYSNKDLFDLQLIIELLRESNLLVEAYELAKSFSKDPILIVNILLDDLKEPQSALNFIKTLPIDDTLRIMCQFSRQLLNSLPNDTNLLLIEIFTGNYKPRGNSTKPTPLERKDSELKKIFYSYTAFLSYMNNHNRSGSSSTGQEKKEIERITGGTTYHPPKPSLIFASFIDKPFQFVVFLEACLETYQQFEGFKEDLQEILTTLYDLYYELSTSDDIERRKDWKLKAEEIWNKSQSLVEEGEDDADDEVDNSLMMLISHMNGVHLNDKTNEKDFIVNTFNTMTLIEDPIKCWNFFLSNIDKEPKLYRVALKYFISNEEIVKTIGGDLVIREKLIGPSLENDLIPLLDLVQILSTTDVIRFSLIQDLLVDHFNKQETEIDNNTKLIESYESELATKQAQLKELLNIEKPTEINIKNQNCYMCELPLELPILYFKCGHIYHKRCLNEEENTAANDISYKCPKCILELESSNKIYNEQTNVTQDIELLETILNTKEGQKDRFKIISEFIGRGGLEYSHIDI
ncbi:E3 ubiquitin-protein ligase Pep5p [Monosporozyma unispora]|nr:hypothetical protein C6P44_002082 [Kazachstania unispora]